MSTVENRISITTTGISQRESAILLNKNPDYYTHIKRNTPKLYRLFSIWGKGNIHAGASAYLESVEVLRIRLSEIYYELSECRSLTRFWIDTKNTNPYKNSQSQISTLKANAFTVTERSMRFHGYETSRKIIKVYEKWKVQGFTLEQKEKIRMMYG